MNTKRINLNPFGFVIMAFALIFLMNSCTFSEKKKKGMTPEERVVEYNHHAQMLLEPLIEQMKAEVSPYKFILSDIKEVERYTWLALDIDTTSTEAWQRLGYINSHMHGKQALMRYESYRNQDLKDKLLEAEKETILYFSKANLYYDKALEYGTRDSARVYLLKSQAAEIQKLYDYAVINLQKASELEPNKRMYKAKIIEAYLYGGRFQNALAQIERYKREYPDSDVPYLHLAGYLYNMGDTLKAIQNYEIAVEKGTKPEAGMFLHRYYTNKGDPEKADYYLQKVYEAQASYDPEDY